MNLKMYSERPVTWPSGRITFKVMSAGRGACSIQYHEDLGVARWLSLQFLVRKITRQAVHKNLMNNFNQKLR